MKVGSGRGDIFAASAWTEPMSKTPSAKALSVTRLTAQGQVVWQNVIPETIVQRRVGPMPCPRAVLIPREGGLITFCVAAEGTEFFYLEPAAGKVVRDLLPNATEQICDGSSGRASFMLPHSDSSIWIFGTGGSCSWLQQVKLQP
ncbi:hypothetical protein [Bradyrhizobium betae]|uniref:hypothetical protein n=1 Tax=Bradyrhizobium betae TaxID=244734 RepID=UPI00100FCEA1|nr:hypothetical protein [Bradyrhizobium betae]